jgi:hypothetical protein
MEKGEIDDNTPPKGFRIDEILSNSNTKSLQNAKQSARTIPGFTLKDELINKEKSVSKSSDEMKQNKSKISAEEISSKHDSNQYLSANVSPSKKLNYGGERDHSINSNLSQSLGYNNEDFNPFGNKNNNNMNLSKPQEFNYDTVMNPSISFMGSMINKMSGGFQPVKTQLNLSLNIFNQEQAMNDVKACKIYDLNQLNGSLNISLSRNKNVLIEMVDDTHIQVKLIQKEVPSKVNFQNTSNCLNIASN